MKITGYLKRKKWLWLTLLLFILLIKLWAQNSIWVENNYTKKIYYFISILLRSLFGWLPFSFGDILYFAAGGWLLYVLIRNIRSLFNKQLNRKAVFQKMVKLFLVLIIIYITFNILWGLNYNRRGVATELNLPETGRDTGNIILMQEILLQKVNEKKLALINQHSVYPANHQLFERAKICYDDAAKLYPFIKYKSPSVKSSFYGSWGNYLGFTGYYNPFSGEAQVNTTVPKFLLPYITTHEIAHQIGYAKEDEANFVGYLAAVNSTDTLFQYSAYLDLFIYANREVYYFDSTLSKKAVTLLKPEVRADLEEWRKFNLEHRSFIEPAIRWMYGKYLQANKQPEGLRSYNEVIKMLTAFYKRFGKI